MSNEVEHPGAFIAEELEARGWLQRDLAYVLGMHEHVVSLIISGKRGISPRMAKALGYAFDISPSYFTNLQTSYDLSRAKYPDPAIRERAVTYRASPD